MSDVKNYAVISSETNIVENVILLSDESDWNSPTENYVVCIDGTNAGIGWKYENGDFIDVRPVLAYVFDPASIETASDPATS